MTVEGETGRTVWRDRTAARTSTEARTVLRNGKWVTLPARTVPMTDWRAGSSRVVQS